MKRSIICALLSSGAGFVTWAAQPVMAQDQSGVADIIVTAQKREQRLQDVPVAVTALTSDSITANRITNVRDLDAIVPNMVVRTMVGGTALPNYTIRGLVSQGGVAGSDKGVAVYIDGVYLGAGAGSLFEIPDVERIEVLRGPQGTLFGRNATGGAINITTRTPDGKLGLKQTFTVGNLNQFRSVTSLSTPQWGPLSAIVSYTHSERRGDTRNLGAGTVWDFSRAFGRPLRYTSPEYLGSSNSESVFAAVKLDIVDDLDFTYRFDYSQEDLTPQAVGVRYLQPGLAALVASQPDQTQMTPISSGRPDAVNNAMTVPSRITNLGHSLTAVYHVSDAVSLKNIAAYRKTTAIAPWTEITGLGGLINTFGLPGSTAASNAFLSAVLGAAQAASTAGDPLLVQATSPIQVNRQWSDEFQLNIDTDPATITLGALYYLQKASFSTVGAETDLGLARNGSFQVYPDFQVPNEARPTSYGGRGSFFKQQSIAAYAQVEGHLTETVDLVGGVRYTKDKKTGTDNTAYSAANPSSFPVDYRDSRWTYSLGVNYKPDRDRLIYAKYSTGYISGGSYSTLNYAPELASSWEAGIKADWFGHMLRTNLALFSVKYSGLQAAVTTTGNFPELQAAGASQVLINAGDARAKGFELETTLVPTRSLQFIGGVGYTDFKYLTISPLIAPSPAAAALGARFLTIQRPKWTVNLSGQYTSEPLFDDVSLVARIDANWKSSIYTSQSLPPTSAAFSAAEQARFLDNLKVDPYWIVNGRIALQDFALGSGTKATVALWGRNLLNNRSLTYGPSFVTVIGAMYEQARTYGVDLTLKF